MPTKGIPWDNLPARIGEKRESEATPSSLPNSSSSVQQSIDISFADNQGDGLPLDAEEEKRDYQKDAISVGRRVAFGVICGSITGASFGVVEILRDAKAMRASKSEATKKMLRFSGLFGGFFGSYHGMRRILKMYYPQSPEMNVATSAALCITPLVFLNRGKLRPLIPYSIMLVVLDAINGMNDV